MAGCADEILIALVKGVPLSDYRGETIAIQRGCSYISSTCQGSLVTSATI